MFRTCPRAITEVVHAEAAQEYLRSLPPEHFMEATAQAAQRKITLESLNLVHAHRPDVQVSKELLVQYPREGQRRPGQVLSPFQTPSQEVLPIAELRGFWLSPWGHESWWGCGVEGGVADGLRQLVVSRQGCRVRTQVRQSWRIAQSQ